MNCSVRPSDLARTLPERYFIWTIAEINFFLSFSTIAITQFSLRNLPGCSVFGCLIDGKFLNCKFLRKHRSGIFKNIRTLTKKNIKKADKDTLEFDIQDDIEIPLP